MGQSAMGSVPIDDPGGVYRTGLIAIGIVVVFLGILVSAILKRRL